jgi:remodeling and spacing factor 1
MVLGLEIGRDISLETETPSKQDETPVRQSRRIAQLKIKEQADRRRIEEETMRELEEKKESEKKKRKKQKVSSRVLDSSFVSSRKINTDITVTVVMD